MLGVSMAKGRGSQPTPGECRRTQNGIRGRVPDMLAALDNLERSLDDEPTRAAPLVKAGLAHAQFETIHPFLDGEVLRRAAAGPHRGPPRWPIGAGDARRVPAAT
jgi:hypothetical protein